MLSLWTSSPMKWAGPLPGEDGPKMPAVLAGPPNYELGAQRGELGFAAGLFWGHGVDRCSWCPLSFLVVRGSAHRHTSGRNPRFRRPHHHARVLPAALGFGCGRSLRPKNTYE